MKKQLTKLAFAGILGLFGAAASAGPVYTPISLFAKDVKLVCTTASTCGTYTATHDLTVKRDGSHVKLWWNLNEPSGESGGSYRANTVGAACPAGSAIPRMTAVWYVDRYLRPYSAVATHCDGVTTSEFDVIMPRIDIEYPLEDGFEF